MSEKNIHHAEQLLRFTPGKNYISTLIFWMIIGNLPLLIIIFFLYDALSSTFQRAPTAVFAVAISLLWLIASYFIISILLEPLKYIARLLQENEHKDLPKIQFTTKHDAGIMINNLHNLLGREQLLRSWLDDLSQQEHITGFYSSNWTESRLDEDITRVRREGGKLTLLLLEVSNYAAIRQDAGLSVANHCLITLAQLAENATRKGDWFSHWRENQILMVLWNDQNQAELIRQRILESFQNVKFVDETDNTIHVVTKITVCPHDNSDSANMTLTKIAHAARGNAETTEENLETNQQKASSDDTVITTGDEPVPDKK